MLKDHSWFCYYKALETELMQCKDEGKDMSAFESKIKEVGIEMPYTTEEYKKVFELIDEMENVPVPSNAPYNEPSDLESIHALQLPRTEPKPYDKEKLRDRIYGAWIGRVTGCLIGKPVEGWTREPIEKLAKAGNNWPIKRYLSCNNPSLADDPELCYEKLKKAWFVENLKGISPTDDDTNYTTLYLTVLERYGRDFTTDDVVEAWLSTFNVFCVCTAEQAAFRNFVGHILPPDSASYRNPYREWIGAQIRGDIFGYVNPGDPYLAADYAFRDACCTHTRNGIYGEMFVAAMIAESAVSNDMKHIIETGLRVIPQTSRLVRDITKVLKWYDEGKSYEYVVDRIYEQYPAPSLHNMVHTIPNAMIVCAALIYGHNDYAETLGKAIMPGMDTDCNGATAGSIIGMVTGAANIPSDFTTPIDGKLLTDIAGNREVRISDMADRTMRIIK